MLCLAGLVNDACKHVLQEPHAALQRLMLQRMHPPQSLVVLGAEDIEKAAVPILTAIQAITIKLNK